jgi:hypothetical protein
MEVKSAVAVLFGHACSASLDGVAPNPATHWAWVCVGVIAIAAAAASDKIDRLKFRFVLVLVIGFSS